MRREALQRGQREGGGLAGTGLGAGHEVAALENEGNGLLLDRARLLVAKLLHRLQQRRDQTQLFET